MYKIKDHVYEELGRLGDKLWEVFVDSIRDENGHIELKVRCCNEHGVYTKAHDVGSIITEDNIEDYAFCEIYYLDELNFYPEYVLVGMNGTIIIVQDMLHYGRY